MASTTAAAAKLGALVASAALQLRSARFWTWRAALVLAFLVANMKSLPLVWHVRLYVPHFPHGPLLQLKATGRGQHGLRRTLFQLRVFSAFFTHISALRPRFLAPASPQHLQPRHIFQSVVTTSRAPLLESDYYLHKSNSSYFSDLDLARLHTTMCLLKHGVPRGRLATEDDLRRDPGLPGRWTIMLGGVLCLFRREIKPYEPYEVWTRILAWDRKWCFLVSHFVRRGSGGGRKTGLAEASGDGEARDIFASTLSKGVFKRGRLTIAPERVFEEAGLIPPPPPPPSRQSSTSDSAASTSPAAPATATNTNPTVNHANSLSAPCSPSPDGAPKPATTTLQGEDARQRDEEWTRERIDQERLRGLEIARHMLSLDALHGEFKGDRTRVVGTFGDF